MNITYSLYWNLDKKAPISIISEVEAKKRHHKNQPYVAIISEDNHLYVVEIYKKGINVRFLDNNKNDFLLYVFRSRDRQSIFLENAIYYEYKDNIELTQTIYNFYESGYILITQIDKIQKTLEQKELNYDASTNWDNFPEFGMYDSVIKIERE